jgi:gamma-glutamylcyclotransferase (GGCT)/AIG2-like uncharacterized protein YtfP
LEHGFLVFVSYGAFDEGYGNVWGELFDVGEGTMHQLDFLGEVKEPFVLVKKAHVAA